MRRQKPAARKTTKLTGRLGRSSGAARSAPELSVLTRVEHLVTGLLDITPRYLTTVKVALRSIERGVSIQSPKRHSERSRTIGWLTHILITSALYSLIVLSAHLFEIRGIFRFPQAGEVVAHYKTLDYLLVFGGVTTFALLLVAVSNLAFGDSADRRKWSPELGAAWYTYTAVSISIFYIGVSLVGALVVHVFESLSREALDHLDAIGFIPPASQMVWLVAILFLATVWRMSARLSSYLRRTGEDARIGRSHTMARRAECILLAFLAALIPGLASSSYTFLKPLMEVAAGDRTITPQLRIDSLAPFSCNESPGDVYCVVQAKVQGRGTWKLFLPSAGLVSVTMRPDDRDIEMEAQLYALMFAPPTDAAYKLSSPNSLGDFLDVDQTHPLLLTLKFTFTRQTCNNTRDSLGFESTLPQSLFLVVNQVDPVGGLEPVVFGPWHEPNILYTIKSRCEEYRNINE